MHRVNKAFTADARQSVVKHWAARLGSQTAVLLSRSCGCLRRQAFGVLAYHRVAPETPGIPAPTWNVTPANFERQMTGLLALGYRPVSLTKALDDWRAGVGPSRRSFVVTFDDGYEAVYRFAAPILQRLEIPAALFLPTAYVGSQTPLPFDDWSAAGSDEVQPDTWRSITKEQCRELLATGLFELGSHTHTHRDFRGRPQEFIDDVRRSVVWLREELGVERPTFSFPFSFVTPELRDALAVVDVRCGMGRVNELVLPGADRLNWPRLEVHADDGPQMLVAKLDGWDSVLRRVWLATVCRFGLGGAPVAAGVGAAAPEQRYAGDCEPVLSAPPSANLNAPPPDTVAQIGDRSGSPSVAPADATTVHSPLQYAADDDSPFLRSSAILLVDQAIVSGTAFVTSVLVGRVSHEDLGLFALAMGLVLFLRGLQQELLGAPYMVYGKRRKGNALALFTGSVLAHQMLLVCFAVACVSIAWLAVSLIGDEHWLDEVLIVVLAGMPFILLREFARLLSIAQFHVRTALAMDLVTAAVQLGGLAILYASDRLTTSTAFIPIGGAGLIVGLSWLAWQRRQMHFDRHGAVADWRHNWPFARWTAGSYLLGSTTPYFVPWLLCAAAGEAATGLLAAGTTLSGLANVIVQGLRNYLLPRASHEYANGGVEALRRTLRWMYVVSGVLVGVFSLLLLLEGERIIVFVYGDDFVGGGAVAALMGLYVLITNFGGVAGSGLCVIDRPAVNFTADIATLVVTLGMAAALVVPLGAVGAAAGLLSGSIVGTVLRGAALRRCLQTASLPSGAFAQ